ncbi:M28 family metallopeptidase [Robertkochia flava]|uniref:M28 family metallopeptidase n=1 Tax=Robertkochia flava TaxID=3447986 RepID=UPI001CCDCB1F|nr:M20/M25/M40 family metallo-hydrolase [Robertkochia marina]
MRILLMLAVALLLISCGAQMPPDQSAQPASAEEYKETPEIPSVASAVDAGSIGTALSYLASDALKGRASDDEGIEMAAVYIARYFEASGIKPYYPGYRDTLSNVKPATVNIVGYLEGSDPELKHEFVVLGAHYDHIGAVEPVGGDFIANGANDNASGTTAVMEIARKMAGSEHLKRSVMFVLFSAEERGLKGSAHLADRLDKEGVKVYAMLNFEMVGVPLEKDYTAYLTGYEMSTMAEEMNTLAGEQLIGFLPQAREYKLFQRSDNYPFYQKFGVPAQTVCTFDFTNFDFYHKPGDEFELMNLEHMAAFVNRILPVVEGMVNSEKGVIRMK